MTKVMEHPQRYAVSAVEYLRMGEAAVLEPDARVELVDGEIIEMAPIGSAHATALRILDRDLQRQLGDRAIVSVQCPLVLDERSVPQPDLVLLRVRVDAYASRHPAPGDVLLVVEVSDTTLQFDVGTKIPLYGRAGIAEAWIVDVAKRAILVFRNPDANGYRTTMIATSAERVSPAAIHDVSIEVSALFPI